MFFCQVRLECFLAMLTPGANYPKLLLAFQDVMSCALTKLATDHPYHTLYSLIALKNGSSGRLFATQSWPAPGPGGA